MFVRRRATKGAHRRALPKEEESENIYIHRQHRKAPAGGTAEARPHPNHCPPEVERSIDDFVDRVLTMGVEGLKREFSCVSSYQCPNQQHVAFSSNITKNRYSDVICLDATRVQLTLDVPPLGDYIHANWVKFDGHDRSYIVAQAPLANTIGDFWRMVFQENCTSVLNVTQESENKTRKGVTYWPQHGGLYNTYDNMFVNTKRVDYEENFVIYTIELLPEGMSNSHIVRLVHMTNWPDKGEPPSARDLLRLLKKVVVNKHDMGPIVVHCTAGVGRSACIIMVDVILRSLFSGVVVQTDQILRKLRDQRAVALPFFCLYVFVVYSVIDYIRAKLPGRYREKTQKFIEECKENIIRR